MCGILACLFASCERQSREIFRQKIVAQATRLRHRGPDWSGVKVIEQDGCLHALAHERLTVVGASSGEQPLFDAEERIFLTVNGEIFNHSQLRKTILSSCKILTESDCEAILHGYKEVGPESILQQLDGQFAFVLLDTAPTSLPSSSCSSSSPPSVATTAAATTTAAAATTTATTTTTTTTTTVTTTTTLSSGSSGFFLAARDPIGICPLYYGRGEDGSLYFASEFKAIFDVVPRVQEFPPGHLMMGTSADASVTLVRYFTPLWIDEAYLPFSDCSPPPLDKHLEQVRECLTNAVRKRLMSDVPWGVLLSGGLDSSLIASIASRMASRRVESDNAEPSWWSPRLHTFSIGLKDSPDLASARSVATFLGTVHHEFVFTLDEALDALRTVVYHLETYDITTIRASVPMYLLARRIKALGVKLVLSGEGADELFGGYSYYHYAPTPAEFQSETSRQLQNLHKKDCLRANKAVGAWGVELTVPFLDRELIELVMLHTDAAEKMCGRGSVDGKRIEKYILRKAFDTPDRPYLPDSILWRQKEQFSDGVGYSWIDTLRTHAAALVSDHQMLAAPHRFPHNTPPTKEAYFYRELFHAHFANANSSVEQLVLPLQSIACSTPKALQWNAAWSQPGAADPSGRSVDVHDASYVKLQQQE